MTLLRPIEFNLARAIAAPDGARVETTTLLPGGGVASVSVRPHGAVFQVSDDGLALNALLTLTVNDLTAADFKRGHEIAEAAGLDFDEERFVVCDVSESQLSAAVAYVADAGRAWIEAVLDRRAKRAERDLAHRLTNRLKARFPRVRLEPGGELMGASTKTHRFDLVASLSGDRFAAFQVVSPAPASIAATHLKFYDLSQAHPNWPREAVVEGYGLWRADDLAVMGQVSSHVRDMTQSWDDLDAILLN